MVRSLLGAQPSTSTPTLATSARVTATLSGAALQARLRLKRSSAYIQAVTRLDAGGHVHSPAATQALIDAIRQELPDVSVDALPHGIVARCYLGAPFEVHTLNCSGQIIQHYKTHESLPALLERARSLALHPGYAFIEVYASRLIAVSASGQTAIIDV
ncbi:hypothetical protein N5J23_00940 [Comamonas aquatica]|uniref:Uncharacterized protein n=1 Tax=Comamonas aquatica TaxID=225991 RepID=A0AA42VYU4_9BURK|nr:hypothetical protein [Comamonas aquatica]MDH1426909.1 hypothetical protein [Comamonas aquatica]MDH1604386.1 hypothetical protein [Comamonas aquatica]MDH1616278.1 hypothetical protein [Comamonas aquatica]MDH2004127.1 hypothetical protein [Comamonas aquatica]